MDNYSLILAKESGMSYNITKLIGNLTWSDDLETLGTKISFDFTRNADDKYLIRFDIAECGDKVILTNDTNEVFRGIITDLDWGKHNKSITCFDYAFYLNQSKTVKQFYKIAANRAILELCKLFNVPVGSIEVMSTRITKIYKDKTIAEIIKDIIQQVEQETGEKYRLEMRAGKLYIIKYYEIAVNPTFQASENSETFKILNAIGEVSKSESIQDMKNSILITSDDEKSAKVSAKVESTSNIKKYGLLQDVVSVDKKNESQAKQIANNKLKELNRVQEDISISLLGNDELRAGRIITLENALFNLSGKYLIKSSSHTYNNSIHKCSINVQKVVE